MVYRRIQIEFPINRWDVDSTYSDNACRLRELQQLLQQVRDNEGLSLDSVKVSGYASPDGFLPRNRELSVRRAVALYNYLCQDCGVPDSLLIFGESMVPWDLFRELISKTDYPWRDDALRILTRGEDSNTVDNTRRMNRLKRLCGGVPWRVVKQDILPRLRSAYVVSTIITQRQPHSADTVISEAPASELITATFQDTLAEHAHKSAIKLPARERDYDRFSLKTNAAYLACGITNIGGEYAFHRHWSVDIPLIYSPYTIARTYRMRFLYVQPEVRFWTDSALRGHFLGVHMHGGVFNVSLDRHNRYQSEKGFHGAGLSYGYSLALSRRWSMEFTVGLGYTYTRYCTYFNVHNGMKYENDIPYHYWGIDKLGINIVYRFGDKSGKSRKEARQ